MSKHLVFGDSFVDYLSLINTFYVTKYSGKTLRGVTKENSPILKSIKNIYKRNPKSKNIIFGFGNVDLHLSFYYDSFMKDNAETNPEKLVDTWKTKMKESIKSYVNIISNFKDKKIAIMATMPSVLQEKNVRFSLEKYINFPSQMTDEKECAFKKLISISERDKRMIFMNEELKKNIKLYKNIKYININYILLNKNKTVKKKFIDISTLNIHLSWEPILLDSVKIPFFHNLGITKENTTHLKKSHEKYLKFKEDFLKNISDEKKLNRSEVKKIKKIMLNNKL